VISLYDLWAVPEAHGSGAANALRERQRSRAGGPSGADQRLKKGRLIPLSYRCATLQRPGVSINPDMLTGLKADGSGMGMH